MRNTYFFGIFLFLLMWVDIFQAGAANPKHEMRATYIATVANIDWPSAPGLSATAQKQELRQMLDSIKTLNLNTVLFQIRDNADALYQSDYEPWANVLTGTRGKDPGYDPLAYCIEECHKRGLSCHAWMNPYRYSRNGAKWTGAHDNPLNYENSHPEWLLYYSSNIIMDPGLPQVRQRVKEVVGDVLNKYDVDGIIFDDYFYAYGGTQYQDSASIRQYKPSNMTVGNWRRNNVRQMVRDVYDTIQAVKPWVTFGISPFGIWTTDTYVARQEGITLPSGISGGNMYEEIYCDPVAWLKDGTIDYISPQLYWATGTGQDYRKLCPWWADLANQFGRHFYSSMAIYRYAEKSEINKAFTVEELQTQANINRTSSSDNAFGCVFYNTKAWVYSKAFRKAFKANQFEHPALLPPINWKPTAEQPPVSDFVVEGQTIRWQHPNAGQVHYAVYAVPKSFRNMAHIWSVGDALLGITYSEQFTLPTSISTTTHAVGVSVLDGYENEYSLRIVGEELADAVPAELIYPINGYCQLTWNNLKFRYESPTKADSYIIQIAADPDFKQIIASQELTDTEFDASLRLNLANQGDGEYFWRVKTRRPNAVDIWSETRSFVIGQESALSIQQSEGTLPVKVVRNGQIIIVKDNHEYTIFGVEIK